MKKLIAVMAVVGTLASVQFAWANQATFVGTSSAIQAPHSELLQVAKGGSKGQKGGKKGKSKVVQVREAGQTV